MKRLLALTITLLNLCYSTQFAEQIAYIHNNTNILVRLIIRENDASRRSGTRNQQFTIESNGIASIPLLSNGKRFKYIIESEEHKHIARTAIPEKPYFRWDGKMLKKDEQVARLLYAIHRANKPLGYIVNE